MKRLAVVIASAACWKDDVERLLGAYNTPADVFAVNDALWLYHGEVQHFVTLHPENSDRYTKLGMRCATPWTGQDRARRYPGIEWQTLGHWGTGSSTLFAVTVALHLGYDRIVLCGAPMQVMSHAPGASDWDEWPEREVMIHREGWTYHKDKLGAVRSMSGWTAELLGVPDAEFLYDRTPAHAAMAQNTVRPPVEDGKVIESFWHCVACGSTSIHALTVDANAYHCTDCGRDFTSSIDAVPWYARPAVSLMDLYPSNLASNG